MLSETVIFWKLFYFFKKMLYTKFEKYTIPNWKRSRKASEKRKLKRSRNQLPNKINFSAFLKISCSNFRLKLRERSWVTKVLEQIKFEEVWVRSKNMFPETITHKIFDTNSSFHVKQHTTRKLKFLIFRRFLLVLKSFSKR